METATTIVDLATKKSYIELPKCIFFETSLYY